MGGVLRAIGRTLRNFGDEAIEGSGRFLQGSLHWVGRGVYSWFRGDRDISDAFAIGLGLTFLLLLAIIALGILNWLRAAPENGPPPASPTPGPDPGPPVKPWWD